MQTKTLYSLNEIEKIANADALHHSFLRKPDFIKADIKFIEVSMLGTPARPQWRCKGVYGKYRVGYCFGKTQEEAKQNATNELIRKWFNDSTPIRESEYARVMWM